MLTLVGKVDRTALVPFDSLEIQGTAGDPLSTAQFKLLDPGSQIPISALQEVIICDETVALTPSGAVSPAWNDSFASNDLAAYTATNNPSGSPAAWTYNGGSGGTTQPLSLYGLSGASSTLSSAAKLASATGGTATTVNTTINAGSGYYELLGLGGASSAVGSLPAPTGKGWLYDVTTLEAQSLLSGNYSLIGKLAVGSGTIPSCTLTIRLYKRSAAGIYTAICSATTASFTMTTTPTAQSSTASGVSAMSFSSGDKLYVDAFLSAAPVSSRIISFSVSSGSAGIANDLEIDTPGYSSTSGGSGGGGGGGGSSSSQPYGITIGSSSATGTLSSAAITDMQNLGITWLRYQIPWSLIDTSGNTAQNSASYHWSAWDSAVSQCNAAGINIILTIFGAPSQFQGPSGNPLNPTYTAQFATQIAQRYNGGSHGTIQGIEVGNEDYNQGSDTTSIPVTLVEQLAATLIAVYPAVKGVSSSIEVGAAAKLQRNSAGYTAFFDTLLNPSTGAYSGGVFQADYLNFHFYTGIPTSGGAPVEIDPTISVPSYNGGNGLPSIKDNNDGNCAWKLIDAKRQQYGVSTPVYLTETGWAVNTNPGRPSGEIVSETAQWTYLQDVLDNCRTSGVVSRVFIFTLGYYAGYSANSGNSNYVRDGMSLVQGPLATPYYTKAYGSLKSYTASYASWGSSSGGGGGGGGGGSTTPLSLYVTTTLDGTLPNAAKAVTATGASGSTTNHTAIGTNSNWGQLGFGGNPAWAGSSSPGPANGYGAIYDSTALEGQTFLGGAWTLKTSVSSAAASTSETGPLELMIYKYNGGVYSLLGTGTLASATYGTTATAVSVSATLPAVSFGTGDKLYWELWFQSTGHTGTPTNILVTTSNSATLGFAGAGELDTPGYAATSTAGITGSGGASALFLLNSWLAQNVSVSATMTESDAGGLAWNVVDTGDYYELFVGDASSPTANTLQLYKTIGGTRSAIGSLASISFTRGSAHTIIVSSTTDGTSTTITVFFDGTQKISYADSAPLGIGQVGLRNDTLSTHGTSSYTAFSAQSLDQSSLVASVPTHNYLNNNNFNYSNAGWTESGSLSGCITFPAGGTFGPSAVATLTFANQSVGTDERYQTVTNAQSSATDYAVPGQEYCLSATINVTQAFTGAYAFLQIVFLDSAGNTLSTTTSAQITSSSGAQRFLVQATAPANTFQVRAAFGGTTTSSTNSGTCTFTALMLEPMWFVDPTAPYVASYPTPICDFLQSDSVTLPDGTAARFNRVFTGFIVNYKASYDGPNRTWDIQCNSAEWLLENATLVNASYSSVSDQSIITGIVDSLSPRLIYAATPSLVTATPPALAYRNVPVVYSGITVPALQFADNTLREVLNALSGLSGYLFGVDSYYNVWYAPPTFNLAPYGFSDSPDYVANFPYYDYSISYDATQLQSVINVLGATISVQTTEAWHLQDGSHAETVQSGKTVNLYLFHQPNATPTTLTVGGTNISCGWDNGVGYGTAQSLVSSKNYGVPNLLSFPSPGYAAGTAISITYTYDFVIYVQVQSPNSIGSIGRALYSTINDSNLTDAQSAAVQGEATLQTYAAPRITLDFKTQYLLFPGQVIAFTSSLDGISAQHFTVQKVTARSLSAGTNEYEVQAGTYLDDFVDFFRNTQKAVTSPSHDPSEPFKQYNNLQQEALTISDSLNIHT